MPSTAFGWKWCWWESGELSEKTPSPQLPEGRKTGTAESHLWALPFPMQSLLPWVICLFRITDRKNTSETITGKSGGKLYFTRLWYLLAETINSIDGCIYSHHVFSWAAFKAGVPCVQAEPWCSHPMDPGWVGGCMGRSSHLVPWPTPAKVWLGTFAAPKST